MDFLKTLIKFMISVLLIWLIFRSVDLHSVLKNLLMVDIGLLGAALIAFGLQIFILAYRWALVTGVLGHRIAIGSAMRMTFISQFFNQALPSTVGGDAVRIWLARRAGLSLRQSVHSVIADRAVATAMLLVVVLVGLPMQSAILGSSMARWLVDFVALGALAGFVLSLVIAEPIGKRFGRFRLVREMAAMIQAIRRILFDRVQSLPILLLSAFNHFLSIAGMMLLARALGLPAVWSDFFVLVPFVLLLSMIPVSLGGWGLREGIMIAAFGYIGMSSENALGLSLLFGAVITVVSLPGGLFWLLQPQHKMPAGTNLGHDLAAIDASVPLSISDLPS